MPLFFQSAVQQKLFKSGIQAGNGKSVEKTILLRLQSDESVRETGMGGGPSGCGGDGAQRAVVLGWGEEGA